MGRCGWGGGCVHAMIDEVMRYERAWVGFYEVFLAGYGDGIGVGELDGMDWPDGWIGEEKAYLIPPFYLNYVCLRSFGFDFHLACKANQSDQYLSPSQSQSVSPSTKSN